jgi:hypothetical protein
MVGRYREADQLISHLAEQKYALDNLVSFAESLPGDESVESMLNDIQPLRDIYGNLASKRIETTIKKEPSGKLMVGGGNRILMPEEDFLKLKKETLEIRSRITGNAGS